MDLARSKYQGVCSSGGTSGKLAPSDTYVYKVPVSYFNKLGGVATPDGGTFVVGSDNVVEQIPQGHVTISFVNGLSQEASNGFKAGIKQVAQWVENSNGDPMTKGNYQDTPATGADDPLEAAEYTDLVQSSPAVMKEITAGQAAQTAQVSEDLPFGLPGDDAAGEVDAESEAYGFATAMEEAFEDE